MTLASEMPSVSERVGAAWWHALAERARVHVESLSCGDDPLTHIPSLDKELQHTWLVWDAWTGGRRRVNLHPIILTRSAHREAMRVAERAFALVRDAGERASKDPEEARRYRFHPDVNRLADASRSANDMDSVARVDLLLREDGRFVACEVNADCPGGYNESLALPRLSRAAGQRLHTDPTNVAHRLADLLVERSGGRGSPRGVIALAYATGYAEDLQICALLERLILDRGGRAVRVAPTALRQDPNGADAVAIKTSRKHARTESYERVSVLYRFYPLEYMAGQKNLDAIVRAVRSGALVTVSSFASIHAQSKLSMARAFAHDRRAALEVFPETYAFADVDRAQLIAEQSSWVIKRDLSRVGDHVFVGPLCTPADFAEIADEVSWAERDFDHQAWIAQRFVPQASIVTPWGPRLVTLGVYLVNGSFSGYFARISETSHCSHDSVVLPVFVGHASLPMSLPRGSAMP